MLARYLGALHGQSILDDAGLGAARTQPFRDALTAGRVAAELVTDEHAGRRGDRRHGRRVPAAALARWAEAGLDSLVAVVPRGGRASRGRSSGSAATLVRRLEGAAMPLRFGVHIPTCIEGMMYPVPFAKPEDILPTAQLAERVGFDSVWGNDHMTTQRYVQREWPRAAELLRAADHLHLRGRAHDAPPPRPRVSSCSPCAHMPVAGQAGGHARSALRRAA